MQPTNLEITPEQQKQNQEQSDYITKQIEVKNWISVFAPSKLYPDYYSIYRFSLCDGQDLIPIRIEGFTSNCELYYNNKSFFYIRIQAGVPQITITDSFCWKKFCNLVKLEGETS